jgi:hypothetical protein
MADNAAFEVAYTMRRQLESMQFADLPGVTLEWVPDHLQWRCTLGKFDCTGVTPMASVDGLWRHLVRSGMKQAVTDA